MLALPDAFIFEVKLGIRGRKNGNTIQEVGMKLSWTVKTLISWEKKGYEYLWKGLNIYSANVRIDNYRETPLIQLQNLRRWGSKTCCTL